MIKDPIAGLRRKLSSWLSDSQEATTVVANHNISDALLWRPYLFETAVERAWHLLPSRPTGDSWYRRLADVRVKCPDIQLAVCGLSDVVRDEEVLLRLHDLNALIVEAEKNNECYRLGEQMRAVDDLIYEENLQLSIESISTILDDELMRARQEEDAHQKGIRLEVLVALLLSQVRGFNVKDVGISRRSQQMDVTVINNNLGSPLFQDSPLIIAEAKNWTRRPGPSEYVWLGRKLRTSRGRARLGFFVTTDEFTEGVYTEAIRDSVEDELIVLLDRQSLPRVWRESDDITDGVENAVYSALMDHGEL